MVSFTRTDNSLLGRWWWELDRWNFLALVVLIAVGAFLTLAASPAIAEQKNFSQYHFVYRQYVFLTVGLMVMVCTSLLPVKMVRRLGVVLALISLMLVVATLVIAPEKNGATRWLYIGGMSLQPSEFLKPAFAVAVAWVLSLQDIGKPRNRYIISGLCLALVVGLLSQQPDIGMSIVIATGYGIQIFLTGISFMVVFALAVLGLMAMLLAYFTHDHVRSRIDNFIHPESSDNYQVNKSLEAFRDGGLTGVGPGEGTVKVPDAHTDFILAVAGEEFGLFACLFIVLLFAFIVLRGFGRVFKVKDLFVLYATAGLLVQFAAQAIINMASTINLGPTKGMTLPFISYGGSSSLSLAIAMGMMLALTRNRIQGSG